MRSNKTYKRAHLRAGTYNDKRRIFLSAFGALAGISLLPGFVGAAAGSGQLIITPDLKDLERQAMRIYEMPAVKASRDRIAEKFLADRNAKVDRQRELIQQDASEHAFAAVLAAVGETPTRPVFYWSLAHAHPNGDLNVPGSRFGIENPDNFYRLASVDDRYRYKIKGRRAAVPPVDGGITASPAQPGENIMANSIGYLSFDGLHFENDGRFEITVDASPANGRPNHLCIAGGKVLIVRNTHADWLSETPYELSIECLDGPAPRQRSDDEIAARAAAYGELMAGYFLENLQHKFYERRPPNIPIPPTPSGPNGGLVTQTASQGWYQLAADEALIVDVDVMGARYFGFQVCDLWMLSYDYTEHLSSLNHHEAAADRDGRVRFVISGVDPGVYNWLDGSGHRAGTITLRWQSLPPNKVPDANTVISRVVKLNELPAALPMETRTADASARAAQRAARIAGWKRRCAFAAT